MKKVCKRVRFNCHVVESKRNKIERSPLIPVKSEFGLGKQLSVRSVKKYLPKQRIQRQALIRKRTGYSSNCFNHCPLDLPQAI